MTISGLSKASSSSSRRWLLIIFMLAHSAYVEAKDEAYPTAELRSAPPIQFPSPVDSNSPSFWDGDTFYLFNSAGNFVIRSSGADLESLSGRQIGRFNNPDIRVNRWAEAVWKTADGILWSWYHAEPWDSTCTRNSVLGRTLTAPQIGAAKSFDNGLTWIDLGIVLRADAGTIRCDTENGYFSGGVGDLSVMLDPAEQYLYIFFGTYSGDVADQGVSIARMAWTDRDSPAGKVWRLHQNSWSSPGLDGISTPLFPAIVAWNLKDADAFWGPSIHWNTHLNMYVMLLNRTMNANYEPEGIYVSYSRDISDPQGWTPPQKIAGAERNWYPQVVGASENGFKGTDKLAGKTARFFVGGRSNYEIVFSNPPSCASTSDKDTFAIGETAHFNVTSDPPGYAAFWNGMKDGVTDVTDFPIGQTNMLDITYGPFMEDLIPLRSGNPAGITKYVRYSVLKNSNGNTVCISTPIELTLRPSCELGVNKSTFIAGETGHFKVISHPPGYAVFWNGTKDGRTDLTDVPVGQTNILDITYGPFTEDLIPASADRTVYTRNFTVKDLEGNSVCTSNSIEVTIASSRSPR